MCPKCGLVKAPRQRPAADRGHALLKLSDTEILAWLERLLKANGGLWPLVSIQTIPSHACVCATNVFNGLEAGLVTASTLRAAVEAAVMRNLLEKVAVPCCGTAEVRR